ncbi:hypothetical protein A2U01_0078306, partial [Trifolium medium]|nr:hypothetical protein [Trifolium medium]
MDNFDQAAAYVVLLFVGMNSGGEEAKKGEVNWKGG